MKLIMQMIHLLLGSLHLFDPSSTIFVKHFTYTGNVCFTGRTVNVFHAGYANTTSAVNAVDFKFSSGNTDAGTILHFTE